MKNSSKRVEETTKAAFASHELVARGDSVPESATPTEADPSQDLSNGQNRSETVCFETFRNKSDNYFYPKIIEDDEKYRKHRPPRFISS